ncbi:MAG: hypothetical protein Q9175_008080 [Cornicularia normoerica]
MFTSEGGDEKPGAAATALLQEMSQLCETGNISGASNLIQKHYHDPNSLPSNWFSPQTDHLVIDVIKKAVHVLSEKPCCTWGEPDFLFLSQLMNLTCDGAMVEGGRRGNTSSGRWLQVFSMCFGSLPPRLALFSLWLFTISRPHETLLKSGLERCDRIFRAAGLTWWMSARGYRYRSLRQLNSLLSAFPTEYRKDFKRTLKKECDYIYFAVVVLRLPVVTMPDMVSPMHYIEAETTSM